MSTSLLRLLRTLSGSMNKTYVKNILKDIKTTKGKVISIGVMVGLAALVVLALTLTGPTMRKTLDKSLTDYDHPDTIVRSTYGLDFEDEMILKEDKDIKNLTKVKSADLSLKDELIRVKSYDKNIKKSIVIEGRLPQKEGEIILSSNLMDTYKIGDKLEFSYAGNVKDDDRPMRTLSYDLVGFMKTSDYFMEDMREVSFVAKKELTGYAYVLARDFLTDKFGEINITYRQSRGMDKTSKVYLDFIKAKKNEIEDSLDHRPGQVLAKIKKDGQKDLAEAQDEIDEAKDEISSARQKLNDARKDLDQGYLDYEAGKDEYQKAISIANQKLDRSKEDLIRGQNELKTGRATYQQNLRAYENKIAKAREDISQKEEEIKAGEDKISQSQEEINQAYEDLEAQFAQPKDELAKSQKKLDETKKSLDKLKSKLEQLEALAGSADLENTDNNQIENIANPDQVESMRAELKTGLSQYEEGLSSLQAKKDDLDQRYKEAKDKIDSNQQALDIKKSEIEDARARLKAGKDDLENSIIEGQQALDKAKSQINTNQANIDKGWADLNQGLRDLENKKAQGQKNLEDSYQKLLDGEAEYKKNLDKFQEEEKDAQKQILDGENDIADGKDALARLIDPTYDVETIRDNQGINTYYQNSLNMDELSKVFPTFFYLIAMLVTLTTMKRFIEEQRTINGTLKALGYTNRQISQRFYIYGIIPSLVGASIGALIGRYVVAKVIIDAYSSGFNTIETSYVNATAYIIFAIGLSIGLIALTVYLSSKKTVNESPASLLTLKAPNSGGKILLERLTGLWNKMTFLQKITARNIFRYKSRMFMTLFGVGGCTALTFFGFAMIDSIKDTVNVQKNSINHYDVIAILDENAKAEDTLAYNDAIKEYQSLPIKMEDIDVKKAGASRDIKLVVADSKKSFDKFVSIRDLYRKNLDLSKEDAVITEKAAKVLRIKPGDKLSLTIDGKTYKLGISNIIENYTGDYIYVDKNKFTSLTGEDYPNNASYIKADANELIEKIEDLPAVSAIINSSVAYGSMDVLMANLNLVIGVITLISMLLALVVLYNLININVSERKRELATIKVLGFYPREVTAYIFREIFILTILGILLGYGLGIWMFRYIIGVVAPDAILLSYRIHPRPYIYSGLITIAISLVLLIIVDNKLKKIDMAEAMSSGE